MIPHASLVELIAVAAASGFTSITVNPDIYQAARESGLTDRELRARMTDAGVRPGYMDGLGGVLPGVPREEHELAPYRAFVGRDITKTFSRTLDEYLRMGDGLGVRAVNTVHMAGRPDTPRDAMAEALGKTAARARTHGFELYLEFIPGTGMPDIGTAAWLLEQAGEPNIGIMFDTRHLARSGGVPADVPAYVRHIRAVQVSDLKWATRDDLNRMMPGDGDLPLAQMIRPVIAALPGLPIGIEVLNTAFNDRPPADLAREGAEAMHRLLATCEVSAA
jgi:sugar phosphate isomerase/epimerase